METQYGKKLRREKIKAYKDETSYAVLLSQIENYSKQQLLILHAVPERLPRNRDLLGLYRKAQAIGDENALNILVNKYDIQKLFYSDIPDISSEEVEKTLESVDAFIRYVNSDARKEKLKRNYNNARKNRYTKYIDYSGNTPVFKARTYLNDISRVNLEIACHNFNIRGYFKMSDDQLKENILKHERCKDIIMNFIRKGKGIHFRTYVINYIENGDYVFDSNI